ncbi:MAG TPA: methyltransferase [Xanthobacteraceae bacterium]|nr:methyltransferase [Xanthobacteraceae bacterium]
MDTTDDAILGGKLNLLQPKNGHRAGHDAILLAAAAPKSMLALDLGAGVGTAGLAMLARKIAWQVTLVEIDPALSALSSENAERNGFANSVRIVRGDVTQSIALPMDAFDLVIMNPPFNDGASLQASPDASRARAHVVTDDSMTERWILRAARHCKSGGTLTIIHRPEATLPILKSLDGRFGAIEIIPVFPKPYANAIRLIVRAIKGRKTPTQMLPGILLNDKDGKPTEAAERILREGASLFGE